MTSAHHTSRPPLIISHEAGYALRGLAMLAILVAHSLNEFPVYEQAWARVIGLPRYGELGCAVFFLMSGYGLAHSTSRLRTGDVTGYFLRHLRRLIETFVVAWTLALAVDWATLPPADFSVARVLTLTFPEGTDVWFLKVILVNYLILCTLCSTVRSPLRRGYLLLTLHIASIPVLWALHVPGYWYVSNLAFPAGYLLALQPLRAPCRKGLYAAALVIALVRLPAATPFIILDNCALAIFIAGLFALTTGGNRVLGYIGRTSLYYYLLSIPVMLAVPSAVMPWPAYLACNIGLTSLLVWAYRKLRRS